MTSRLTRAQKLELVEHLLAESAPSLPPNPSLQQIRRRGEDILSGKAKTFTWQESEEQINRSMKKLKRAQALLSAQ